MVGTQYLSTLKESFITFVPKDGSTSTPSLMEKKTGLAFADDFDSSLNPFSEVKNKILNGTDMINGDRKIDSPEDISTEDSSEATTTTDAATTTITRQSKRKRTTTTITTTTTTSTADVTTSDDSYYDVESTSDPTTTTTITTTRRPRRRTTTTEEETTTTTLREFDPTTSGNTIMKSKTHLELG